MHIAAAVQLLFRTPKIRRRIGAISLGDVITTIFIQCLTFGYVSAARTAAPLRIAALDPVFFIIFPLSETVTGVICERRQSIFVFVHTELTIVFYNE